MPTASLERPSSTASAAIAVLALLVLAEPLGAQTAQGTSTSEKAARTKTAKAEPAPKGSGAQAIVVLVNDEPVTAYEIEQRARLNAMGANISEQAKETFKRLVQQESTTAQIKGILEEVIKANQGKTREQILAIFEERKKQFALNLQKQAVESARGSVVPGLRKQAQEELVNERLMLQEAKKLGIEISEEDANRTLRSIAERNKLTEAQFVANLKNAGVDPATMKARFTANYAWRDVIRRKYQGLISINQRDIDKVLATTSAGGNEDTFELQIQKITLVLPSQLDQAAVARRLNDGEAIRQKFAGCKTMSALIKDQPSTRFDTFNYVRPSSIPEPTRSLLLAAKDNEMLPPAAGTGGVEIFAVCGRRALKADEKRREAAAEELTAKEFEIQATRYLRNLKQDAHIEYR